MKQKEKTEQTKARILELAIEEFGSRGYAAGTLNDICRRGVAKGLIYHNFRDKDDLYLAAVRRSCDAITQAITADTEHPDLLSYLEARRAFCTAHPREASVFFEALIHPAEHLKAPLQAILADFRTLNESIYEHMLDHLELRPGVSKEEALAYYRQVEQMFNSWYSLRPAEGDSLAQQIEDHELSLPRVLDYMLYGVAVKKVSE